MTEVEKMRSSQLADMSAPELQVRLLNEPKDVKMLRKKGFILAVHTPAVLHNYDSFGHIAVNRCQFVTCDKIPAVKKDESIQEMTQNFFMLYPCYDRFSQNYSGCISRTMADFLLKLEDYQADGAKIIVYKEI